MSLKLVYGRAGTGKSTCLLEEMKRCADCGEKAIMLVPEQFSHIAETLLIDKIGFLSSDLQVTSFKRLAARTLKELGYYGVIADNTGKSMLMARVLSGLKNKLTLFGGTCEKPGFVGTLLELMTELKKSKVTADLLKEQADSINDNPLFRQKLTELGMIYETYQAYIAEKFIDAEDNLTKLAERIPQVESFQETHFFIDEFFRFTKQEMDCIKVMLACGMDITISLCMPCFEGKESSVFAPAMATDRRLTAMAKEVGATVLEPVCLDTPHRFANSPELLHVESQYFAYPCKPYEGAPKRAELFMSADTYREVVYFAVKIKRLVKENGFCYRDIAIIAGDLDTYQKIIKTVFPVYEIPVFVDDKRDLLSHPVMLTLFSVFDILTSGFDRDAILTYLKTGYSGLTMDEADRLENFALAGHLNGKDWLSDERFLTRADSVFADAEEVSAEDDYQIQTLLKAKDTVLKPILKLKETLDGSKNVKDRATALVAFLEEIQLRKQILAQTEQFKAMGNKQLADEYAEVYNLLLSALDQLVLCLGEENMGLSRLSSVLEAGFAQCQISIIPPAFDQVFLGDVKRSLAKNVKALFLVGANDKSFPSSAPPEGMLTDAERIYLNEKGLELAPDTKKLAFDAQFNMYSAINISSEFLFVSYPIADMEGKGLRPSPLIGRMKKLFPDLVVQNDILEEKPTAQHSVASKQSAYGYVLQHLDHLEQDKAAQTLYDYLAQEEETAQKLHRAKAFRSYKNVAQRLTNENVQAMYSNHLMGSVSRFEKFASCPFSYFIKFGLKAKERKIMQINTPDIGWLLHNIIDSFCKTVHESGMKFHELELPDAQIMVDNIMGDMKNQMFIKNLYSEKKLDVLMKRLKRLVMKSVWAILEHIKIGKFEPCSFEFSFDKDGDIPPVEIDLPTGDRITLIGRIDRLDTYSEEGNLYVKIIDYKSGEKNFRMSDIYNRLSLQLAVYVTAVWENGQEKLGGEVTPAGMFYFKLLDPVMAAGNGDTDTKAEMLKKFKMSGLVLEDMNVIRAIDGNVSGYSAVIPVRIGKNGDVIRANSKSATITQMNKLKTYIKRVAGEIGQEILSGNVEIRPYKEKKKKPCDYCEFRSICAFDEAENEYRVLDSLKEDDVWELI